MTSSGLVTLTNTEVVNSNTFNKDDQQSDNKDNSGNTDMDVPGRPMSEGITTVSEVAGGQVTHDLTTTNDDVSSSNHTNESSAEQVGMSGTRTSTDTNIVVSKASPLPPALKKLQIDFHNGNSKTSSKRKSRHSVVHLIDNTPGADEGLNVVSIYEWNSDRSPGRTCVDDSDFVSRPVFPGWTRLPEIKCRNILPKKMKQTICEIEIELNSWQIGPNSEIIPRTTKNILPANDQEKSPLTDDVLYKTVVENSVELFGDAFIQVQNETIMDKSRRGQGHLSQQSTANTAKIRVGEKYQAIIMDHPSTYDRSKDETNYTNGDVLWDPVKADAVAERKDLITAYLERKDLELNAKYMLMDSLHKADYNTNAAMKLFIENYRTEHKRLIEFNATEAAMFNSVVAPRVLATKKDFVGAAKVMNRTVECMLVHYYLWKRRQRDYQRCKRERRKEPDYCSVCDDGGTLIICELCRKAFHIKCCSPPLTRVPEGDWYCMPCTHSSPARTRRLSNTPIDVATRRSIASAREQRPSAQNNKSVKVDTKKPPSDELRRQALRAVHKELFPPASQSISNNKKKRAGNNGTEIPNTGRKIASSFSTTNKKSRTSSVPQSVASSGLGQAVFYDIVVPITPEGLLVHISEVPAEQGGGVSFGGYRRFNSGKIGPAEEQHLFRSIGDTFFSIDGTLCSGKSFNDIRGLLKMKGEKQKFKVIRMVHKAKQNDNGVHMGGADNMKRDSLTQDPAWHSAAVQGILPLVADPTIAVPNPLQIQPSQQQQQEALPDQMAQPQPKSALTSTVGPGTSKHFADFTQFQSALAPLKIPQLMNFLNRRGIYNANTFLQTAVLALATQWATEQHVPFDFAMDIMGAARLQVRKHVVASTNQ
jgi:PHD-finger/ELM2 domain